MLIIVNANHYHFKSLSMLLAFTKASLLPFSAQCSIRSMGDASQSSPGVNIYKTFSPFSPILWQCLSLSSLFSLV